MINHAADMGRIRQRSGTAVTGWVLAVLVLCAIAIFFWDGIVSLYAAWMKPEYSHGPLIPLISAFLLVRELRDGDRMARPGSRSPGLVLVLLAIAVGLVGNITQIPYFITYGLIGIIGGMILMFAGFRRGIRFWPAWLFLVFMLPLPTALYWQVSTQLQLLSSKIGVAFISALRIPVWLEGNVIDLGVYRLQVAEACSGLRYLFPLSSFSFLFATLYRGPFWHRVVLFLSCLPITVLMNSFRIGAIGVLVNYFGIEQAEGFLHLFEGWVIFVACIAILFVEAKLLQLLQRRESRASNVLDLDWSGMAGPARRLVPKAADSWLLALTIVTVAAAAGWTLAPKHKQFVPDRKPLAAFPLNIGQWDGKTVRNDVEIEKVLGADDYLSVNFLNRDNGQSFNFFTAYYNSTTDGTGIHNPEVCIQGGGWEVAKWERVSVMLPGQTETRLNVNRAIIRKGDERKLVYYWFEMRGQRYVSEYRAKFQTILDSMTRSRADGALVRFMMPLAERESEASGEADKRLLAVMPALLAQLPEYVPP